MKYKQPNYKRQDPIASLVRCVQCGYLLRMEEFFSPEDNRVCADYWDVLKIKQQIYDCPTCGAALSALTVKPWAQHDRFPVARLAALAQDLHGLADQVKALAGE